MASANMAGRALTALDAVPARRTETKLRIKCRYAVYFVAGDVHQSSKLFNSLFGEIAQIFLDILQNRYQAPTVCRMPL
jgi:hypothetical protein